MKVNTANMTVNTTNEKSSEFCEMNVYIQYVIFIGLGVVIVVSEAIGLNPNVPQNTVTQLVVTFLRYVLFKTKRIVQMEKVTVSNNDDTCQEHLLTQ